MFVIAKTTHLHANHAVDEENEANQDSDPRQGLERLDERPKKSPDTLAFAQQFHQPHDSKESEKVD